MAWCLPKFAADVLRQKIVEGDVSPTQLGKLTSAERRKVFEFMGKENAQRANALFESKLLLKNQEQAMISWAKQAMSMNKVMYRDTLSKIKGLETVLNEKQRARFLEDLVEMRLGVRVSQKEGQKLFKMAKEIDDAKANLPERFKTTAPDNYAKTETKAEFKQRIEYGIKMAEYKHYIESIHPKTTPTLKSFFQEPITNLAGLTKSVVASFDNSFWGIQGITTLLNPSTTAKWAKNFVKSYPDLVKGFVNADKAKIIAQAEIYSRPNAVNGNYARMKLAIGLRAEEAFPVLFHERIPVLGRVFKASNHAYNIAALRLRADLADMHISIAKKNGIDITSKVEMEGIGRMVNAITGRGGLGVGEAAAHRWNALLFSPRLLSSTITNLTGGLASKKIWQSKYARKTAAKNLIKMAATYHALMAVIEMIRPGSTEFDPRKPHFGQVRVGEDTWVTVIGPYRPLIRAVSTLVPTYRHDAPGDFEDKIGFWRQSKTGNWTKISWYSDKAPKFGTYTPFDVLSGFLTGKAAPLFSLILDHWKGSGFMGEPLTLQGDIERLVLPISVQSLLKEMEESDQYDEIIMNMVLEAHGINVTRNK